MGVVSRADVDQRNNLGATALFVAAQNNCTEVLHHLVLGRADLSLAADGGFTPLYIAAKTGSSDAVESLISARAIVDPATEVWLELHAANADDNKHSSKSNVTEPSTPFVRQW